jgi:hypothetical protein
MKYKLLPTKKPPNNDNNFSVRAARTAPIVSQIDLVGVRLQNTLDPHVIIIALTKIHVFSILF